MKSLFLCLVLLCPVCIVAGCGGAVEVSPEDQVDTDQASDEELQALQAGLAESSGEDAAD